MKRLKSNAQPLNGSNNNILYSWAATFALSGWMRGDGGGQCLVQGSNTKLLYNITVKPKPLSILRTLERCYSKAYFFIFKMSAIFPCRTHRNALFGDSMLPVGPRLFPDSFVDLVWFFFWFSDSSSIGGMSGSPMICTSLTYLGLPDSAFPSALSREGKEQRR